MRRDVFVWVATLWVPGYELWVMGCRFLARGIPCGGLETGAEKIKTMAERDLFGGNANAAYDPCYHQFCDTLTNVNADALGKQSRAATWTLSL